LCVERIQRFVGLKNATNQKKMRQALHSVNAASVSIFFLLRSKHSEIIQFVHEVVNIVLFLFLPEDVAGAFFVLKIEVFAFASRVVIFDQRSRCSLNRLFGLLGDPS
jgi:hypothetical protein